MALAAPGVVAVAAAAEVVTAAAAADETIVPMAAAEGAEVAGCCCFGPPMLPMADLADGRVTAPGAAAAVTGGWPACPLMRASSWGGRTGPCGLEGGVALCWPNSTHSTRWAGNSLKWSMQVMCWQYWG